MSTFEKVPSDFRILVRSCISASLAIGPDMGIDDRLTSDLGQSVSAMLDIGEEFVPLSQCAIVFDDALAGVTGTLL